MTKIHKYLQDMSIDYKKELPYIIDNLFTDSEISEMRKLIEKNRALDSVKISDEIDIPERRVNRYHPKHAPNMSRLLIEFDLPQHMTDKLDIIAKDVYSKEIKLCNYTYIDYQKKYGYGENNPALPPHLDADENLVTINYQLDSNIVWDIYVEGKSYTLKNNQAIVFSAVNQVHWRPKRRAVDGEFLEIVSFDYSPIDNYKFTGDENPLDPHLYPEVRDAFSKEISRHPRMQKYFKQWREEGLSIGIPQEDL